MAKANGVIEVKKVTRERGRRKDIVGTVYTYTNPNNPYYTTYFVGGVAIEDREVIVAKLEKMVHGSAYTIKYRDIPTNANEYKKVTLAEIPVKSNFIGELDSGWGLMRNEGITYGDKYNVRSYEGYLYLWDADYEVYTTPQQK